jgi:hypothetical protein
MENKKMTISRFEYMTGLKCRKLLWTLFNEPESIPCYHDSTHGLLYAPGAVAELAQSLFPEIILTEQENGVSEKPGVPWSLPTKKRPIFKANITSAGISAKIDVLKPAEDNRWDIVQINTEVLDAENMSSGVAKYYRRRHEQHVQDIAFQCHCCEKAGVTIRNCYLTHVNSNYVRRGALDVHGLLALEDVTEKVRAESVGIAARIAEMQHVIEMKECPAFEMFAKETRCLSCCHLTQLHCPLLEQCREIIHGKRILMPQICDADYDVEKIRNFMGRLVYPLHILDLNYFTRAIPIEDCKPYQMLPFAISLQKVENLDSEPLSHSWLWDGNGDPRSLALNRLGELIGGSGSIIIRFKKTHEENLKEFATAFPEQRPLLKDLISRMLDPCETLKQQILEEQTFNGLYSLEAVFPDMKCSDPWMDSKEFIQCIYGKQTADESERTRIRLEHNCGLQTMRIIFFLRKLATFTQNCMK